MLKLYHPNADTQPPDPLYFETDGSSVWEAEAILRERTRRSGRSRKNVKEYLIRWAGFPPSEDSWIPEADVGAQLVHEWTDRQRSRT